MPSVTIETAAGDPVGAEFLGFAGGERHVQIDAAAARSAGGPFAIRARVRSSDDLMDMLLARDALGRAVPGAEVDAEIPYLPYARQDRVCAPGQAYSMEVSARLVLGAGFRRVAVWDCHSWKGLALLHGLAANVGPERIIAECPGLSALLADPGSVLVCPDAGARQRAEAVALAHGAPAVLHCTKRRDPATGLVTGTALGAGDARWEGGLGGRTAVIVDDICDGGYTFIRLAEALRAAGAGRVALYVTHGIFSRGLHAFIGQDGRPLVDEFYATDSFPAPAVPAGRPGAPPPAFTAIPYRHAF